MEKIKNLMPNELQQISKEKITSDIHRMEKKLGVKFEEDFKINYLNNPQKSQRKFSDRWETKRNVIWFGDKRTNTPSWLEILGLSEVSVVKINKGKLDNIELYREIEVNVDNTQLLPIEENIPKSHNEIMESSSKLSINQFYKNIKILINNLFKRT